MNVLSKVKFILNALIRRGYWYDNVFLQDCRKFTYSTFNTRVVNLGSSSAVSAFDYKGLDIKGANWALRRNPLAGDLAILKNYSSFLSVDKSVVIVSLCPFSSLSGSYAAYEDRYYTFLHPSSIPYYSYVHGVQVRDKIDNTIKYYSIYGLFQDIKHILPTFKTKCLSDDKMEADSINWMKNWLHEFSLRDLESELSLYNKDNIKDAVYYLDAIVDYCKFINAKPVIVVPPMYHTLSSKFNSASRYLLFDSVINQMKNSDIVFLNYMSDEQFTYDRTLFKDSYLMNNKGAKVFTKRVLSDLQLI